ncbi:MAG: 2-keto-4-pentenoate hydratase [Candidatus Xenobia bacterium]
MARTLQIEALADALLEAERSCRPRVALTDEIPELTLEDAYRIQEALMARRLRENGFHGRLPKRVGWKIGVTAEAVQKWLGITHPDFGVLLDDMVVPDAGLAPIERLIQGKAEGEIAFVLRHALRGPGITAAQAIAAVDFVLPAIEIIDSRLLDWKIKAADTIADNGSSARFVLGCRPVPLQQVDLKLAGMVLRRNGEVVSSGTGAACMGHPVNALVWLANELGAHGHGLEAGEVVLSGALSEVCPLAAGDHVEVEIAHVGQVEVRF